MAGALVFGSRKASLLEAWLRLELVLETSESNWRDVKTWNEATLDDSFFLMGYAVPPVYLATVDADAVLAL